MFVLIWFFEFTRYVGYLDHSHHRESTLLWQAHFFQVASIYNEICFIAHCHLCFRAIGQPSNYLDRIGRLIWQLNRSLFEGLSYSSYIFLQCSSLSTLWFIEIHFSLHAKMQRMKMYQIIQTSLLSKWHCCPNWEKSGESQR